MLSRGQTYEDHLGYCKQIEAIIHNQDLSYPLLATLARLEAKSALARTKGEEGWLMESEFAGIGTDMLVDKGFVERDFRKYDWHPSGVKGTYVYRTTQSGSATLTACKVEIKSVGLKLYY